MKKYLIVLLLTVSVLNASAQGGFEAGYFITNSGEKINCLIRNKDWGYNPRTFKYRTSENSETLTGDITSVTEFGTGNAQKYKRFTVAFDRTTDEIDKLSMEREPVNTTDTIFLRVVVEGKASLYIYESGELRRFFIQINDEQVQQLVYKSYLANNNQVAKNEAYKQQLQVLLQCGNDLNTKELKYEKRELAKIFTSYNNCSGAVFKDYTVRTEKSHFNINIRPGIKFAALKATRGPIPPVDPNLVNISFKDQTTFRIGIEAEFILPINKNKTSIICEPTFQYFNSVSTTTNQPATVKYTSLEIPIGFRYTFIPYGNSTVFINALYATEIAFNSKIDFPNSTDLILKPGGSFSFGAGMKIKQKYSAELRAGGGKDLLKTSASWSSNYSYFSLVFGYKIN